MGLLKNKKSINDQVEAFLELTQEENKDTGSPNFLKILWGDLGEGNNEGFFCRLTQADVEYSLFDKHGKALRAKIAAGFSEVNRESGTPDSPETEYTSGMTSSDVTRVREVKAGDTLPLMAHRVYDDISLYIRVARANRLNSLRRPAEGRTLRFPPLKG